MWIDPMDRALFNPFRTFAIIIYFTLETMKRIFRFIISLFDKKENIDPMKYLVVGLGNMGAKYDGTRHNIGFDVIDHLAKEKELNYKQEIYGDLAEYKFKGRTFFLLKPSTYMNLSGKAVRYWLQKKKIQASNLLIVVDDVNLPFGTIRIRAKGSDGGHNGLKSINELLGTSQYARLRFGIGNDYPKGAKINFVLGKWTKDEQQSLPSLVKSAAEAIKSFGTIGLERTMNLHNNS